LRPTHVKANGKGFLKKSLSATDRKHRQQAEKSGEQSERRDPRETQTVKYLRGSTAGYDNKHHHSMETLHRRNVTTILGSRPSFHVATNGQIRSDSGAEVRDFPDLVEQVARLSFYNPEHVLLFRGQRRDYPNYHGNTSLKPTIFRPSGGIKPPDYFELNRRYGVLRHAEELFSDEFAQSGFIGRQRIMRHRLLRWAILQHYEVCGTPLLDVTHSLRVAASFATNDPLEADPMVYVLGVPALSGSISASSEQRIQTIRLTSICPPDARRPYFQEGYLLAEYPDLATFHEKQNYRPHEIDFGRRLLAKFRLPRSGFWSDDYAAIPKAALYPDKRDPLVEFCQQIAKRLKNLAPA
jgi:hypothetical protein